MFRVVNIVLGLFGIVTLAVSAMGMFNTMVGQQPVELSATRLVQLSKNLPHDWHAQRQVLGFAAA